MQRVFVEREGQEKTIKGSEIDPRNWCIPSGEHFSMDAKVDEIRSKYSKKSTAKNPWQNTLIHHETILRLLPTLIWTTTADMAEKVPGPGIHQ